MSGQRLTASGGWWGRRGDRCVPLDRSPSGGCDERSGDRGSATVWTVGGIGVIVTLLTALLWFVAAVVTRHRAESAADLAALAAASTAVAGEQRACDEARWVTDHMGVELRSCRLSGWDALVEVVAQPPAALQQFGPAAARARAGPVEPDGSRRFNGHPHTVNGIAWGLSDDSGSPLAADWRGSGFSPSLGRRSFHRA